MRWLILRGRRRLVIAILGVILTASAGAILTQTLTSASDQSIEPWPSFTMTWRETARGLGPNGSVGTQLFRLEYTDRRHFRTTLLENPAVPEAVGSSWAFDGTTSTFHDARHGKTTTTSFKSGELTVPSEWLVPGKVTYLAAQPSYTTSPVGDGLAILRHEETLPNGTFVREETTYRLGDGIPMRQIITVNGAEAGRREVVDFQLGKP